ncbi:MFS transporter [Actinocrinis sp.]|uniref:MFS transporter n=1 Tax=Actinocrinis sp. TaxID=1920516 RepID=UPI002C807100|nr:MFS transporter [Actinocrinis sp.]HXR70956.1 MFS transporter [Actinocrinis sp.]
MTTVAASTAAAAPAPAGAARSAARRRGVLFACCLAQFMSVLDISAMNIALPSVQKALGFTTANLMWVVTAYSLALSGCLLLGGRLADLLGQRRMMLIGIAAFTAASLIGGTAVSGPVLVLARCLQGVAASVMVPATLAVLTSTFTEPGERAKAMGLWSAVAGGGASFGGIAGGLLTSFASWRWTLLVNVPLGLLLLVIGSLSVERSRPAARVGSPDVLGAGAVTLGLMALVAGIGESGKYGWGSAPVVTALALAAALLLFFVLNEAKLARDPLVPLVVFRNRALSVTNAVGAFSCAAFYTTVYFTPLLLQQVLHASALRASLLLAPQSLCVLISARGVARFVPRLGTRTVLSAGLASASCGLLWLSRATEHATYLGSLIGPCVLLGCGWGLIMTGSTVAAVSGVPRDQTGLAAGLINTNRQLGGAIGIAVLAGVATARSAALLSGQEGTASASAQRHAAAAGYDRGYLVGALLMALAFAVARVLPGRARGGERVVRP